MIDKAKGFDILNDKLDFNIFEPQNNYFLIGTTKCIEKLNNEEVKIINDCLNDEPDSIDKIIEDFGKIGYYLSHHNNDYTEIWFTKDRPYRRDFRIYKNAKKWYYKKINLYNDSTELEIDELRLLNRVLRLWGVEV